MKLSDETIEAQQRSFMATGNEEATLLLSDAQEFLSGEELGLPGSTCEDYLEFLPEDSSFVWKDFELKFLHKSKFLMCTASSFTLMLGLRQTKPAVFAFLTVDASLPRKKKTMRSVNFKQGHLGLDVTLLDESGNNLRNVVYDRAAVTCSSPHRMYNGKILEGALDFKKVHRVRLHFAQAWWTYC